MSGRRRVHGGAVASWGRGTASVTLLGMVLLSMVLAGCSSSTAQQRAQANKAVLDRELQNARVVLGIPEPMLQPVVTQEQRIAAGSSGWNYNYDDAAANYTLLHTQLLGIEQTATETLRKQTDADLQAFTSVLTERRNQGFIEAGAYQLRLEQALQDYAKAKQPGDYARIDATVVQQTAALRAMWPAYLKLEAFKKLLQSLRSAGIGSPLGQTLYEQNLQAFREASSADRYTALERVIDGQQVQLMADQVAAMPYLGTALLDSFQARIDLLKQYGEATATFQQQHDAAVARLAAAKQPAEFIALGQTLTQQMDAMTLPLVRGQARHDLGTLKDLVANAQKITQVNPYDGIAYPVAYEYADQWNGVGDVQDRLNAASTAEQYSAADDKINILITNLRALLDNLKDPTKHSQPHAADLQLLQHYGILQGKAIVVSLREQTARLYDNGKMVYWAYVTTGRPERVSPPGLHYVMFKGTNMEFKSSEPKTSPFYYAPTKINYGMLYANYGYFLHDAWWRAEFGPNTNLPHWDPAAFNGGSHGCINLAEEQMIYMYNWTPMGTPVVVY